MGKVGVCARTLTPVDSLPESEPDGNHDIRWHAHCDASHGREDVATTPSDGELSRDSESELPSSRTRPSTAIQPAVADSHLQ